jgi:hypothetical protein
VAVWRVARGLIPIFSTRGCSSLIPAGSTLLTTAVFHSLFLRSRHTSGSFPVAHHVRSSATSSQLSLALKNPFARNNNVVVEASKSKGTTMKRLISGAALALVSLTLFQSPAFAKAAAVAPVVEHLHTGQKIANFIMSFGLPQWAVLAIISAMPVVELRGAIPVGIWLGMPITKVLPICVLGNMTPIIPLLFLLRNDKLKYVKDGWIH